jgi:hypothetical protein
MSAPGIDSLNVPAGSRLYPGTGMMSVIAGSASDLIVI